jgi:uncharacterized protein YjbI with pentapeptide repeats
MVRRMATRKLGIRERRMRWGARFGALAAASLWVVALGPGFVRAADPGWIAADEIVRMVADGQPVELDNTIVIGDLDLHEIEQVPRTFTCTRCAFGGSIRASNVIFERMVDLSGSTIAKGIDFGGAIFRDAFLMRDSGGRRAQVVGPVSFSLANFGGRAIFDRAQFEKDVDFRVAQFGGDSSFADVSILGDARFDSATFEGRAQFNGFPATSATFGGLAGFTNSTFKEKADFRQRDFAGPAMFDGVSFDSVDFTLAKFFEDATFDGASINGSGVFRSTRFLEDLWFRGTVLRGLTDFQTVSIDGSGDFSQSSASDRFVLTGLKPGTSVRFTGMSAPALDLDLDRLTDIGGERVRIDVLSMIEAGARARGDLDLANQAAYRRSQLQTAAKEGLERVAWQASENVGGYLVQPLLPIRAMIFLFVIGTAVRAIARIPYVSKWRPAWDLNPSQPVAAAAAVSGGGGSSANIVEPVAAGSAADPPYGDQSPGRAAVAAPTTDLPLWIGKALAAVVREGANTLRAAVRLRPLDIPKRRENDPKAYGAALVAFAEWLAWKVLFALFVIGLANSNPTFKQLVEAVS